MRGLYLRAHVLGEPWEPVSLPVRAPTAVDVLEALDDVVAWAARFHRGAVDRGSQDKFHITYRTLRGSGLGNNEVPARITVETFAQLVELLDVGEEVTSLQEILATTQSELPELVAWVTAHPLTALDHRASWHELLGTVAWIQSHDTSQVYVRQLDVPGVDTKFIEHNHGILRALLDAVLPREQIDPTGTQFDRRFLFRTKPATVRLRLLHPVAAFPDGVTDLRIPVTELAKLDIPVESVFIIENEVTFLAFPRVVSGIALFGEGYALGVRDISWLASKDLVYWGDIDTHGFAILNKLRSTFPAAESMLMDEATLLAHRSQFAIETAPTRDRLPHLTSAEAALYQDLIEDRFGHSVRLEQERIRFSLVDEALQKR